MQNKILYGIVLGVGAILAVLESYLNIIEKIVPKTQKIVLKSEKLDTPPGTSAYLLTSVGSDSVLNLKEFRILPFSDNPVRHTIFKYNHYNKHVDLMVNQNTTPYTYKISRDLLKKEFEEKNFSFEFLGGDRFKFGFVFDGEVNKAQFKCEVVTGQLKNIPCEVEEKVSQPPKTPFWPVWKISHDRLKDGSLGPEMLEIPPGKFTMGAIQDGGEADEKPVHPVEVESFAMCRYEITFEEYDRFVDATNGIRPDDEGWGRAKLPVINVSWDDAKNYLEWLSEQTGQSYDLPSEAQWEYAAQAKTQDKSWTPSKTSPVGSFKPNRFGLYDTLGNVREWVDDPYHTNYEDAPENGKVWLEGGYGAVLRGCSWSDGAESCRVANRFYSSDFKGDQLTGFRCIRYPTFDISRRLRDCERHFKAERFYSNKGGNAFKCYKEVLNKDQNNAIASKRLEKIEEHYVTQIKEALEQEQWDEAERYVEDLRLVNPDRLDELKKHYVNELTKALFKKEWNDAKCYLTSARLINPNSSELDDLEKIFPPPGGRKCTSQHKIDESTFQDCLKIIGNLGPEMVIIPGGNFWMGDKRGEPDERPVHRVEVTKFAMCRYEVTFEEYDIFVDATNGIRPDDEGWGRGKRPVINVSWNDAMAYVNWLSEQTGKPYGLPSEAQWEYAARAGSTKKYWWGNSPSRKYANYKGIKSKDRWKYSSPVGSFDKPNKFSLYDTVGNVWEWVADPYHDSYRDAPKDGSIWEKNEMGNYKMLRGGSWFNKPKSGWARAANRHHLNKRQRNHHLGFRCSLKLE